MALIDVAAREIHGKIVYYGPGLGGKTTNLRYIHSRLPDDEKSELVSITTENERTLFFDFMPLDLGTVHGFTIRFHLYTVPGQERYDRTRSAVLKGADGAVFVADAAHDRLQDNLLSLHELAQNLKALNRSVRDFPLVMQYNKTDLPDALSADLLDRYLNTVAVPRFEAVAVDGVGVFETLRAICKLATKSL